MYFDGTVSEDPSDFCNDLIDSTNQPSPSDWVDAKCYLHSSPDGSKLWIDVPKDSTIASDMN